MIEKRRSLIAVLMILFLLSACSVSEEETRGPTAPRNTHLAADFSLDEKGRPSYPGAVLGVDVSVHQEKIDWERVREDGVSFAILRLGYRGNTAGGLNVDESFAENYVEARKAGLSVGAYFYSQAVSESEAREEAAFVLRQLDGVPLELPVFFDWEEASEGRTGGKANSEVGAWALAFCEAITAGGYQAGVYFNQQYGYSIMHLEQLTDYSFWIAEYEDNQSFGFQTDFWQFTGQGHVDGIDMVVDMNLMYAPEEEYEQTQKDS
ncbi:MAG: glycoside hydrolase family 25 protein [Oscillospiraceae bacterium]|nr:glycoside hydrolase family 25 protein [Oscillospiraceae bacterium]